MKTIKLHSIFRVRKAFFFSVLALWMILLFVPNVFATIFSLNSKAKLEVQENITLKGIVVDYDDNGIEGVLVSSKDSSYHFTLTDADGKFLFVLREPALVSFSKSGYQSLDFEFEESDSTLVVMLCTALSGE